MARKSWKKLAWILMFAHLFLGLSAPLNPFLTTKPSVFIWTFLIMTLGSINVFIVSSKAYPPEEFSIEGETPLDHVHEEREG